jgi:hypothetical protein
LVNERKMQHPSFLFLLVAAALDCILLRILFRDLYCTSIKTNFSADREAEKKKQKKKLGEEEEEARKIFRNAKAIEREITIQNGPGRASQEREGAGNVCAIKQHRETGCRRMVE